MPAAWPCLFEILILLILVPAMERGVFPCLAKRAVIVPITLKIVLGMLFAAGSAGLGKYNRTQMKWDQAKHGNITGFYAEMIITGVIVMANCSPFWRRTEKLLYRCMNFSGSAKR